MKRGTTLRKAVLTVGDFKAGCDQDLLDAIERFEPLPFAAAKEAIAWLRRHVAEPSIPVRVVLLLDAEDGDLLGFFVIGYTTFKLAPGDQPIVMIAHKLETPDEPQVAADVAWIARGAQTEKGFGKLLFSHAVSVAISEGAIAMIVTPHDADTAQKVWMKRFNFRPPRDRDQPPDSPPRLWYPVHKPDAAGWPS